MGKIVLIDGNSILKKAFYHVPLQTNLSGLHINAICGFLNLLFSIINDEKAEYLTIVFGNEKADENNTKPMPESYTEQLSVMKEIIAAMNVNIVENNMVGTAEILKTLIKSCKDTDNEEVNITIVSGDKNIFPSAAYAAGISPNGSLKCHLIETKDNRTEIIDYQKMMRKLISIRLK